MVEVVVVGALDVFFGNGSKQNFFFSFFGEKFKAKIGEHGS